MTTSRELRIDPTACAGHGACAELAPELITLDEWGYPLLRVTVVPPHLGEVAREAVAACPALALRLTRVSPAQPVRR